ncbi:Aspartate aminotransferase [Trichoderma ghanense]|uniref:Aspartate aminotransferase n=1 Tax=Trichoderma ghanense TaxID=65468 RepID=A0ABY2H7T2_9HYPO
MVCFKRFELVQLSEDKATNPLQTSTVLTYGAIRGSSTLRERIASLYEGDQLSAESVLITQGAIAANFLVFYGLVGPGAHVICVHPTYQQLFSVPESLGAEVSLWRLRPENGLVPDVDELETLVKANTKVRTRESKQAEFHSCREQLYVTLKPRKRKMIIVNNPNNPTGVPIPRDVVYKIVEFAKARGILILSDEVYRPLFHDGIENNASIPPSVADLGYEKAIVTGSLSKAYSLAGTRVGWIASRSKAIIERLAEARHHTAISVSLAGRPGGELRPVARRPRVNCCGATSRWPSAAMVAAFVEAHSSVCSGQPVDNVAFCRDVLDKTKVLLVPGSLCFGRGVDFAGYVRVGYVGSSAVLAEALQKLGEHVRQKVWRVSELMG